MVFLAGQVVLVLGLRRLAACAGLPAAFTPIAFGLLLVNPLLISFVGVEVVLGAAGSVWVMAYAAERRFPASTALTTSGTGTSCCPCWRTRSTWSKLMSRPSASTS